MLCKIFSYDFPKIRNLPKIFLRSFQNVGPGDWHCCVTTDDVTIQAVLVAARPSATNPFVQQTRTTRLGRRSSYSCLELTVASPSLPVHQSQSVSSSAQHSSFQADGLSLTLLWELLKRLNWTESLSWLLTSCHRRVDQWPVASTSVSDVLKETRLTWHGPDELLESVKSPKTKLYTMIWAVLGSTSHSTHRGSLSETIFTASHLTGAKTPSSLLDQSLDWYWQN